MKIKRSDYNLYFEAEANGCVASMDNIVLSGRSKSSDEFGKEFRKYLPGYDGIYSDDDMEEVIYYLNGYIKDSGIDKKKIDESPSGGSEIYLLPITENIKLKVLVVDEYYGDGDYNKHLDITNFIINCETDSSDIIELVNFVKNNILKV